MRNLLKLKLRAVLWTEFLFRRVLRYFQVFVKKKYRVFWHTLVYRVRHIKCYRAIELKLLIISKNISDKSFSVREGRHTGLPNFFIGGGTEAPSRSTPLF